MAELPEYKRHVAISPANSSGSFQSAMGGVAESHMMLADIGNDLAQNSALQMATIEGAKAGQKPGRKLLPAITATDKAFVEAYKTEEYNNVARIAEENFNATFFEASKNPSVQGINKFKSNAQSQIERLSNLITEENRPKFRRDLESAAESSYYRLMNALEAKNKEIQKVNFQINTEKKDKNIQTYAALGEFDKAKKEYADQLAYINQNIGTPAIPSQAAAERMSEASRQKYLAASEAYELHKAQGQSREADFLAERAKNAVTPDEVAISSALLQQQGQYNNLRSMQSAIAINKAVELGNLGELTESIKLDLENQMTPLDLSRYQLHQSTAHLQNQRKAEQIAYVKENADNELALATVSSDALDGALADDIKQFSNLQGRGPSFEEVAQMAQMYQAPITSFTKQLSAMISSKDPQKSIQGSAIYASMARSSPRAVAAISSENEVKASLISGAIESGIDANDAFNTVSEQVAALRSTDIKQRKKAFEETVRLKELRNPSIQESVIKEQMGFDKEVIPSGLYRDYMNNLEKYYVLSDNWDEANAMAKRAIERVYSKTNINGYEEVMYLAPSRNLPYGENEIFLKNLMINKVDDLFKRQKERFDRNDESVPYYYRLAENIIPLNSQELASATQIGKTPEIKIDKTKNLFELDELPEFTKRFGIKPGQAIPIERVDRAGNVVSGTLNMKSDDATVYPEKGKYSSYGLYMVIKGKVLPYPIYSAKDLGVMERFVMSPEDVKLANSAKALREEARYKHALYWQEVNRKVHEARDLMGESDYE